MDFFITSDNVKIYYKVKGQGSPIIFIHGITEDHNIFRIQEKVLSRNYKIITYDLRGHGMSTKTDKNLNLERLALDLLELMDYLHIKNVILVGWSLGGSIIFEYIDIFGTEKISKICIVDKGPKAINEYDWNLGLYKGKYTKNQAIEDLNQINNDWIGFLQGFIKKLGPSFNEDQFKIAMEKMKKNNNNIIYSIWKSMIEKDYRYMLDKIDIPTLILIGEKSTFYSIETGKYLKDNIKDSRLIIFKNCTHLLVLENPIEFNRVLKEFI